MNKATTIYKIEILIIYYILFAKLNAITFRKGGSPHDEGDPPHIIVSRHRFKRSPGNKSRKSGD